MCQLAIQACRGFTVDPLETERIGPSYTIETARELSRRGKGQVSWLIGADMLRSLPTWHEPAALIEEVDFVVMARPGWVFDWDTLPAPYRKLRERVVNTPLLEISATQIRRRVAQGLPIEFLTPEAVVRYIREYDLYRA